MSQFAYLSDTRFMKLPPASGSEPFALAGIAWDGSVTNRPGARFGPRAIRQASHMLCDGTHPHFGVSPARLAAGWPTWATCPCPTPGCKPCAKRWLPLAAALIRRHHMVWLGGDHSITLPLLRAYRAWLGRPLAVIHFDAHCDTWTDHFGEPSGTAPGCTRRCRKAW
jgi:agmatinase